jgi:hypothetical protein
MVMLLGILLGCLAGWQGGRILHLDQIERLVSISLSTLGAWFAGGVAIRALDFNFGTSLHWEVALAAGAGAVLGVVFYGALFHPHHTGGRGHRPLAH